MEKFVWYVCKYSIFPFISSYCWVCIMRIWHNKTVLILKNNYFALQKLVIVTQQSDDRWRQEGKSQQTTYYVNIEYTLFSAQQQACVSGRININNHTVGQ
jgi:hypothetical protein